MKRLVVLLVLSASPAAAQPATIDQLVATALARSPELRAARAAIPAGEGDVTQAQLRSNPMLTAGHQQQVGGSDRQTDVTVEWPLALGRRPARTVAAAQQLEVTRAAVADRERLLAAAVREQAGRVLAAQRVVAIADEALTSARSLRDLLERRASEGVIPQLEANQSALEMWRLEAERAFAAADAEVATIELKTLVGLPPDAPLALGESLEGIVRAAPAGAEPAASVRADVREAGARVALGDARIELARREGGVDLSLFGGYSQMRIGFSQFGLDASGRPAPIDGTFHYVGFGTTIALPLWNRNQGTLATAAAERDGARALVAARELAARAELEAAAARDREARRAVDLYAASIRALALRNADVILEAYELGAVRLMDLLDNQRRYLDIERTYTDTLLKAYDARVALQRARGEIR